MAESVACARKWGNSIGVTIPKEFVEREKIRPNDALIISVRKAKPIASLFCTFKTKKTAQQLKDEARSGWD